MIMYHLLYKLKETGNLKRVLVYCSSKGYVLSPRGHYLVVLGWFAYRHTPRAMSAGVLGSVMFRQGHLCPNGSKGRDLTKCMP